MIGQVLNPGGRVVELLRSCYQTEAYLTEDSDTQTTIVWKWCEPDAPVLGVPTRINSRQWDDPSTRHPPRNVPPPEGVFPGEVIGADRTWDNGGPGVPVGPLLGTPDQWLNGASAAELRAIPNDRRCCCGLTPHPWRLRMVATPPFFFPPEGLVLRFGDAPDLGWGFSEGPVLSYLTCWSPRGRFVLSYTAAGGQEFAVQDFDAFNVPGLPPPLGRGRVKIVRCCPLRLELSGLAYGDLPAGNPDFPPAGNAVSVDVQIDALPDFELGLDPSASTVLTPPYPGLAELGLDPSATTALHPATGALAVLGLDPSATFALVGFPEGSAELGLDPSAAPWLAPHPMGSAELGLDPSSSWSLT